METGDSDLRLICGYGLKICGGCRVSRSVGVGDRLGSWVSVGGFFCRRQLMGFGWRSLTGVGGLLVAGVGLLVVLGSRGWLPVWRRSWVGG
jgi:hypothetical protein|uniref:Uncharacterized protein n=1 Tax=Fagus sylvatica TaxID=28930 RepID=A0A2N9EJR5_FAGSY